MITNLRIEFGWNFLKHYVPFISPPTLSIEQRVPAGDHILVGLEVLGLHHREPPHLLLAPHAAADAGGLGSGLAPAGAVCGVQRGAAQAGEVKHPVVAQAEGLQYIIMHVEMQYSTLHHINQTSSVPSPAGAGSTARTPAGW